MRYFGGKKRIARHIAQYINLYNPIITDYYEPFCGMCSVGRLVYADNKYFSDVFEPVISYWNGLRNGWLPPEVFTEADYKIVKSNMDYSDPVTAFAGWGCSFGGKWFASWAKSKRVDNYVYAAYNYSKRARNFALETNSFTQCSYLEIQPQDSVIYLDPPYKGTTKLSHLKDSFDYDVFYQYCLDISKDNKVYISEYSMPSDKFECVLSMPIKCTVHTGHKQGVERIEKLFVVKK